MRSNVGELRTACASCTAAGTHRPCKRLGRALGMQERLKQSGRSAACRDTSELVPCTEVVASRRA